MINPYELLGVTIDSTLKDLKTSFYSLALLLHPDRGGTSEEMIVLQSSYDWIKSQILNTENNKKNYTDLLDSYTASNILPFSDIFDEVVFDTKKFNEEFDNLCLSNIENDGYGVDMEDLGEYKEFIDDKTLIEYKEPDPSNVLVNYSLDKPINMYDYKESYTSRLNLTDMGIPMPPDRTFEDVLKEHGLGEDNNT
jgi:hypothetical protein